MIGTVPGRPRAVKIGIAAAIVIACFFLAAIPLSPLNIIAALVFLATALGLRNGNAWSGYGGALFLAARWAGVLAAMARFGAAGQSWGHSGTADRADRLGGLPVIPGRAGAFGKWTDAVPVGMDRARHRGFSGPRFSEPT